MQNQRPAHRHTAPPFTNANSAPMMGGARDWSSPSRGYSDPVWPSQPTGSMHDNAALYAHAWNSEDVPWNEFIHEEPSEMEGHEQSMFIGISQDPPTVGGTDDYNSPKAHDSLIYSEDSFIPVQGLFYNPASALQSNWGPQASPGRSHRYNTMTYTQHTDARLDSWHTTSNEGLQSNDPQWAVRGDSQSQQLNAIPSVPPLGADAQKWTICQKKYSGNRCQHSPSMTPLPFMMVNVAAQEAIDPELLAQVLNDPLGPGFPEDGASKRKHKKLTVRCVFLNASGQIVQNTQPKQFHEYAAGIQSSKSAEAARCRFGNPLRKDSESVPLMRITLVEIVAWQLLQFMGELEAKNSPLTFRGRKVHFNHLRIVNLYRPTAATVQPTLEILPDYCHLYPDNGGAL